MLASGFLVWLNMARGGGHERYRSQQPGEPRHSHVTVAELSSLGEHVLYCANNWIISFQTYLGTESKLFLRRRNIFCMLTGKCPTLGRPRISFFLTNSHLCPRSRTLSRNQKIQYFIIKSSSLGACDRCTDVVLDGTFPMRQQRAAEDT